jgi:choline dehydrogenase-like flavoprotein
MPNIIGGNTSAPTMMIGERVAEFIIHPAASDQAGVASRPEPVLA